MTATQKIFEKQLLHVLLLGGLLAAVALARRLEGFSDGELLGVGTPVWTVMAVIVPIAHQGWVWICWRLQLHLSWLTRTLGPNAFRLYGAVFAILGISRIVALVILAESNAGTLPLDRTVLDVMTVILLLPSVYLFYSVARYFGLARAMGLDHFDPAYRSAPLVRQGIFRFTRNGMYSFGLLVLFVPGLVSGSLAATVVAAFSQAYIWVHYRCTEKPDMDRIYGSTA